MKRIWLALLAFTIGTNLVTPLFPFYSARFHLNNAQISLLFATYAIFLLPSLLLFGSLSDQLGRKRVLIPVMILFTLASVIYSLSTSSMELFIARAIQGISTGAFIGACTAYMVDNVEESKRGRTLLLASFTTMIGFGIGPGISGNIMQYFSWRISQLPFFIHITLMVIAIMLLFTVRETVVNKEGRVRLRIRVGVPADMKTKFWRFIAPAGFVFFALNGTVIAMIPVYTVSILHSKSLNLGGNLLFLLMLVGGISQLLVQKWAMNTVTKWGIVLTVIGAFVMLSAGPMHSAPILILGTIIEGIGNGWAFKGSLALAGNVSEPKVRAQVISTYYIAAYAGFSVPVLLVGLLSVYFGLQIALLGLAIVLTLISLMIWGYRDNSIKKKDSVRNII